MKKEKKLNAKRKKTAAAKSEQSELLKPIWAVIDRAGTRLNGVTYSEALISVSNSSGTIITKNAANRADGGLLKS